MVEGRNLPVMDPTGKSDPYCIVRAGNQEQRTSVQYSTVAPMWNETLQFDISGVPQLMQNESGKLTLHLIFIKLDSYLDSGSGRRVVVTKF